MRILIVALLFATTLPADQLVSWGYATIVPGGLGSVKAVAASASGTVVIKADNSVAQWDNFGFLQQPSDLGPVKAIAAGGYFYLAVKNDGTVQVWGDNNNVLFTLPSGLTNVKSVAAGANHSLALKNDGTVVGWPQESPAAVIPNGLNGVIAIAAGTSHSLALKSDGTVVAWGLNDVGQTAVPAGLRNVVSIAAGESLSLAIKSDGTVAAWGGGAENVPAFTGVVAIAAGSNYGLALKQDGTLVGWGDNFAGQLNIPSGMAGVKAIAAAAYRSLAIAADGVVLSMSPLTATLFATQTTQFKVDVQGSTNPAVTWSISPSAGSVNSTGLYTAPASIPATQAITVTARSQADATKFATATVTLNPGVGVTLSPTSVSLQTFGQTQQFTASVVGTTNPAVTWSVSPALGSISTAGLYTAPNTTTPAVVTVRATSVADPARYSEAIVVYGPYETCPGLALPASKPIFDGGGGTLEIRVSAHPTCSWTVSNDLFPWLVVTSGGSGIGNGTVRVRVDPFGGLARLGSLTIGTETVSIFQRGAECRYGLSQGSASLPATGGSAKLGISFPPVCGFDLDFTATPWIRPSIRPITNFNSYVVDLDVASNPSPFGRSLFFSQQGIFFSVTQAGTDCSGVSFNQAEQVFQPAGGTRSIVVSAPTGCPFTASSNSAFVNITAGSNGSGATTVTFNVQPNTGATIRSGTLTIAGRTLVITQAGTANPILTCATADVPAPVSVRATGHTELVSPIDLQCTGSTGGNSYSADLVLSLNTNVTNRITDTATDTTDALLTAPGGVTVRGRIDGPNRVRFASVPFAAGETNLARTYRISNIRVDAHQLGTPFDNTFPVIGTVSVRAPLRVVMSSDTRTLAQSRATSIFATDPPRVGSGSGRRFVDVKFTELFADAFKTQMAEAGGATADTPTRFLLRLSAIPTGVTVWAPLSNTNNSARLVSADNNGVGGQPLTGQARPEGQFAPVQVVNGTAFLTWEVTNASAAAVEAFQFGVLFENTASDFGITTKGLLGPLNPATSATASAPVPHFFDPDYVPPLANLRVTSRLESVATGDPRSRPGALDLPSCPNCIIASFVYEALNDSDQSLSSVVLRNPLPNAMTAYSCTASSGTCAVTAGQVRFNVGTLAPGARVSVTTTAAVTGVPNCPNCTAPGTLLENAVSAAADQADPELISNASSTLLDTSAPACTFSVDRDLVTVSPNGGAPFVAVTATTASCDWTASSPVDWIQVSGGRGTVSISLSISSNATNVARSALLTIAGRTVRVVQSARGCAVAVSNGTVIPQAGGTFAAAIATAAGCAWEALSTPDWLVLAQPRTGTGPGSIGFTAQANPSVVVRTGYIEVAGEKLQIVQAPAGYNACPVTLTANGTSGINVAAAGTCSWTAQASVSWLSITSAVSGTGPATVTYSAAANTTGAARTGVITIGGQAFPVTQSVPSGLRFVALDPCRVMETRAEYNFQGRTGSFGPPYLRAGETRSLTMANSNVCQIPATAKAYVLNVTLIPRGPADFVTVWPAGEPRPDFWTVRSPDGQIVANSAIVKSGGGAVQVYSSNDTDMIIDIAGYFTDDAAVSNLVYYPLTPCRVIDTRVDYRSPAGPFGPPSMNARETRNFRFPVNPYCTIPAGAAAYSVTITAVPPAALQYLTAWPAGGSQPNVSNINSPAGRVLANSVILPASADGSVSVFTFDRTDFLVDVNGYFAPDNGTTGLYYYPVTQCRVSDSGNASGSFGGPIFGDQSQRTIPVAASGCSGISSTAKAYAINATAIPNGNPMPFLTLWPTGQDRPNISVLNAFQGQTVTNSAIIPAGTNGSIEAFTFQRTNVVLEISGYFGR